MIFTTVVNFYFLFYYRSKIYQGVKFYYLFFYSDGSTIKIFFIRVEKSMILIGAHGQSYSKNLLAPSNLRPSGAKNYFRIAINYSRKYVNYYYTF